MAKATDDKEEKKHVHNWVKKNDVESYCSNFYGKKLCVVLKIGVEEFERREAEWDSYFKLLRTTPAFLDWQEMKIAFKQNPRDMEKIAEIRKRVQARTEYLSKPDSIDPWTPFLYVVEGSESPDTFWED